MKQYNYIYKITNLANGKIYIGKHSTDNLNDSYMGSGKILCKAKAKYGKNAFKKEIIAFTDNEDSLNFLEKFYIKKYKSQDSSIGYNITDGGEGTTGFKQSDETRKKISIAKRGKTTANKGKHLTEEAKALISAKAKGRKVSDDARKKMSTAHKGKPSWIKGRHHSDAARKKMSETRKGKKLSNETRAKIGATSKGRTPWNKCKTLSPETKSKMSISQKLRNQNPTKWITPDGEIKIMGKGNVGHWHHDWKLIEE